MKSIVQTVLNINCSNKWLYTEMFGTPKQVQTGNPPSQLEFADWIAVGRHGHLHQVARRFPRSWCRRKVLLFGQLDIRKVGTVVDTVGLLAMYLPAGQELHLELEFAVYIENSCIP